ncbi:Rad9 protein [Ceratobasidium theobromae]|uniref:Rad9 protein n=1 Tax=Ceratobasidium theobromae TaxID=1582974 RepID=A0A5N5QWA8_9AGAM|nr:Rad9 protein [Ceratobasidium theobromae]
MQTTLSPTSLRTFTKGLACIARYGDELCLHATPEQLTLCATNAAKTAYCGIKFLPEFFDTYRVGTSMDTFGEDPDSGEELTVRGQLLVKTLLSVLRHKSVEKSLDKCEFNVVEGVGGGAAEGEEKPEEQSAESRLVLRMHCKFGVIKTHKLYLNQPPVILAPTLPQQRASRVTVGPRAMRDLLDHFGRRADAQLQWLFNEDEIRRRAGDAGKHQIATEISVPAEEFDLYDVAYAPVGLAFHLREINASITLAESLSLPLELSFTESSAPMIISLELDAADHLAMVATSAAAGFGPEYDEAIAAAAAKRQREDGDKDGVMQSSAATGSSGIGPNTKRRMIKVVEVARSARTDCPTNKSNTSGSGQVAWSTTPSASGSGPRGGTQRMQDTPSFALPPNAHSTQHQDSREPLDAPSFALEAEHQSTPQPPPQPQPQPQPSQPTLPQGTPSFVLPPNAQSTQRPPGTPSFNVPPKAQSTFQHPRFQMPSQVTQSQQPPSQLFTMPPPPPRPLFLPSSQFSQADILKEAGLGDLEHMSQKEFDELMGDDEEVPGTPGQENRGMDELEEMFNESEFDANDSQIAGTQGASIARLGDKTFKPLFEDD